MSIKERKERERAQRREVLIDAAERIFFAKGFENATMEMVAEEAEYSKATLYLYFKSKEDLYLAIIERGNTILRQMFTEVLNSKQAGFDKIRSIGEAYCAFAKKYPAYFNAMLYFETADSDRLLKESPFAQACFEQSHQIFEIVIEVLEQGLRDRTIRKDIDPNMVAILLWAQTTGVLQIAQKRPEHLREHHKIDPDKMIEATIEFIGHSLKA
jgi:AcrR family transcriptional regulator